MPSADVYLQAPSYCHPFFDLVKGDNLLDALHESRDHTSQLFNTLPDDKTHFAYAEGKWTVAEILRHIIDCERMYVYRAFRFSRFDPTPLEGFNEDTYIQNIRLTTLRLPALFDEYLAIRQSTIRLYEGMSDEMLDFSGIANGYPFTARSFGFMTIGHNLHHLKVIREKYL